MALKVAKEIPVFRNEDEEAEFWSTHDTSLIWEKAKPVNSIKMPPEQVKAILERAAKKRESQAISMRLERRQIEAARKVAARKSIGYQTQLRMWIAEGIEREAEGKRGGRSR